MSTTELEHEWHVLDFFRDDEDSCALTIFINGVRFHILADATELDEGTEAGAEYHGYLRDMHGSLLEDVESPDDGNKSTGSDSGVDVKEGEEHNGKVGDVTSEYDVEQTLKNWMVSPLVDSFVELAPPLDSSRPQTLQDWYHCRTRFCKLAVSDDGREIEAVELDATPDLLDRIDKLIPSTFTPKYISDKLNAPTFNAGDLYVLESSDQPPGTALHPCRVQHSKSKETYFLKVVDNSQPQAIKREVDVLRRIRDKNLREQFNFPLLEGLVAFERADNTSSSKATFMGFLQTEIPNPTPLTMMLSTSTSQEKRKAWAEEVSRIKELLHEHKIVWGDAKADNFVVDDENKLWIIDFGGGYTEGWIDPELSETKEGDNTGTEKIVNALEDPAANVRDSYDEGSEERPSDAASRVNKKRKRENVEKGEGERNGREVKSVKNE